jgi:hypothetical protein
MSADDFSDIQEPKKQYSTQSFRTYIDRLIVLASLGKMTPEVLDIESGTANILCRSKPKKIHSSYERETYVTQPVGIIISKSMKQPIRIALNYEFLQAHELTEFYLSTNMTRRFYTDIANGFWVIASLKLKDSKIVAARSQKAGVKITYYHCTTQEDLNENEITKIKAIEEKYHLND